MTTPEQLMGYHCDTYLDLCTAYETAERAATEAGDPASAVSEAARAAKAALLASKPATCAGAAAGLRIAQREFEVLHCAGDARGLNALVLATIANAIEQLERREGIAHVATAITCDSAQPCASSTLLSQIRDEVLRTIRAEAVFDAAETINAGRGSNQVRGEYRMSSPNKARADLISAATWCRAENPQEALFQLAVVSEMLGRILEGDASDRDRLSDGVYRMLHSVADVIETLAPGTTLERDGLGFFFLSRRCDVLHDLRTTMKSAPPVADE